MSSETQDVLDKIFATLSGGAIGSGGAGLAGILTSALTGSGTQATASPKQSGGSTAASIGMDILKSGLGLVPLVGGLLGLFGGGGSDAPAPLVKYALPQSIQFQGAENGTGIVSADYDQGGMARAFPKVEPRASNQPYVNVTVNAMDARSFLDRSSDIAAAVRDAMLNLNSINDVVNDL
jgi:hypothetical protein